MWFPVACSTIRWYQRPNHSPPFHKWGSLVVYCGRVMKCCGEEHLGTVLALLNHHFHACSENSLFSVCFESDHVSHLLYLCRAKVRNTCRVRKGTGEELLWLALLLKLVDLQWQMHSGLIVVKSCANCVSFLLVCELSPGQRAWGLYCASPCSSWKVCSRCSDLLTVHTFS